MPPQKRKQLKRIPLQLPEFKQEANGTSVAHKSTQSFYISKMGDVVSRIPYLAQEENPFAVHANTIKTPENELFNATVDIKKQCSIIYTGFRQRDQIREILDWIKEVLPDETQRPSQVFFLIPTMSKGRSNVPIILKFDDKSTMNNFRRLIQENENTLWTRQVEEVQKSDLLMYSKKGKGNGNGGQNRGNGSQNPFAQQGQLRRMFGGSGYQQKNQQKPARGPKGAGGDAKPQTKGTKRKHSDGDAGGARKRRKSGAA